MSSREECERHVYRLALLLTGSQKAATRVIRAVRKAQPDLRRLDRAHLERLTILRSREQRSAGMQVPGLDQNLAAFLGGLDRQPREAWILVHAFGLDQRPAAKAMDCSVTALQLHLDRAHEVMATAKLPADAPQQLAESVKHAQLPQFYLEQRRRSMRIRRTAVILGIVLAILGAIAMVRVLLEFASS